MEEKLVKFFTKIYCGVLQIKNLVMLGDGLEPPFLDSQSSVLPLYYPSSFFYH